MHEPDKTTALPVNPSTPNIPEDPSRVSFKKGPELNVAAQAPQVQGPVPSPSAAVQPVVTSDIKKSSGGKLLLYLLLGLAICVSLTVAVGYALIRFGGAALLSSQRTSDPTLTHFESVEEMQATISSLGTISVEPAQPNETGITIRLSEKQVLAWLAQQLNNEVSPQQLGARFTPMQFTLEIEMAMLGKLLAETNVPVVQPDGTASVPGNSSVVTDVDFKGLEGVYATIEGSVDSSGTDIRVAKISLGNSIIDSIFSPVIRKGIEEGGQISLTQIKLAGGGSVKRIVLEDGYLLLTYGP